MLGAPRDVTLNSEGNQYELYYISERESYAARWLGTHAYKDDIIVYTDDLKGNCLHSQGRIPQIRRGYIRSLQPDKPIERGSYIFLGYFAVAADELTVFGEKLSLSDYPDILALKNKVYATGGSAVYKLPSP